MSKLVCAVVGVGPGNGAAIARRFCEAGYKVALLARTLDFTSTLAGQLDGAIAVACDVTSETGVMAAFSQVRNQLGDVSVLVYNAGAGSWGTIEEITATAFEENWKVNALGSFLAAQQVIPSMKKAGAGSIVFIGATASRRGAARTAAFAPAKAAQRALAESMARHLWPLGIHVSLLVIDGVVDLPSTRERMPDKDEGFFVKPSEIAALAHHLCTQDRSAWSFEVEARPFGEKW